MDFGPLVDPPPHLRLPLNRTAWIGGQTEAGPDEPRAEPFASGVLVRRPNSLECYSHGLKEELWSHRVPGASGFVNGPGHTILIKPETSIVTQYEMQTGAIKRSIETNSDALLVECSRHNFLLMSLDDSILTAFDWSGTSLWKWKYQGYCRLLSTPDKYVVVETGTHLHVLDALSGKDLWQFEAGKTGDKGPQDHSSNLTPGFPSVVALGDQLMTTVGDGRIFKHDLSSGELIQSGQTPFRGAYQVSQQSVFILNQFSSVFSEYNHLLMKEEKREDLTKELQDVFQGRPPRINALLVTEDSIIWTTMYGMLMGLEREARKGKKRIAWLDHLDGALMPIGVPPKALAGYMYYSAGAMKPEVRKGLVAYQSGIMGSTP